MFYCVVLCSLRFFYLCKHIKRGCNQNDNRERDGGGLHDCVAPHGVHHAKIDEIAGQDCRKDTNRYHRNPQPRFEFGIGKKKVNDGYDAENRGQSCNGLIGPMAAHPVAVFHRVASFEERLAADEKYNAQYEQYDVKDTDVDFFTVHE